MHFIFMHFVERPAPVIPKLHFCPCYAYDTQNLDTQNTYMDDALNFHNMLTHQRTSIQNAVNFDTQQAISLSSCVWMCTEYACQTKYHLIEHNHVKANILIIPSTSFCARSVSYSLISLVLIKDAFFAMQFRFSAHYFLFEEYFEQNVNHLIKYGIFAKERKRYTPLSLLSFYSSKKS